MRNRGLKTLIISTALIPSLLIALALGIYINLCRLNDLNTLLRERGQAAVTQLAVASRQALRSSNPARCRSSPRWPWKSAACVR